MASATAAGRGRAQANDGPYRADWATLVKYQAAAWYKDAKFGIFIHWGVYSVPAAEASGIRAICTIPKSVA